MPFGSTVSPNEAASNQARMYPVVTEPARPTTDGQLYRCTSDYALANWRNVLMVVWRKNTTRAAVNDTSIWCDRLAVPWPDGVFLLTIIQQGAAPPSPDARRALASYMKSCPYIVGSAVTIEGKGFRSALVRGVVTSLSLLAEQPFPHQVCPLPAAVELFAAISRKRRMAFDAGEATRALLALRAKIERDPEPMISFAPPRMVGR